MRRFFIASLVGVLSLVAVSCGGDDDGDGAAVEADDDGGDETSGDSSGDETSGDSSGDEAGDDEAGDDQGSGAATNGGQGCEVSVTGDLTLEFTGDDLGQSSVGTDYWMSADDLAAAAGMLTPDAEVDADAVEARLAEGGEPIIYILLLNCVADDDETSLSFYPGGESTYADVPFGPGTYTISEGGALGGGGKGTFGALVVIEGVNFGVTGGTLEISSWDASGIAGSFEFEGLEPELLAEGTPKRVSVTGTFDYACPSLSKCA